MTVEEYKELLAQEDNDKQRKDQKEGKLQARCVKSFRSGYPLLADYMTHLKNEEPDEKRRMISAAMGVVPGYPDLMLFVPATYCETINDEHYTKVITKYSGLALELKNGKSGRQTLDQKICQARMQVCGYKYVVVRSLKEFEDAVDDYVKNIDDLTIVHINRVNVNAEKLRAEQQQRREKKATEKARQELAALLNKKA